MVATSPIGRPLPLGGKLYTPFLAHLFAGQWPNGLWSKDSNTTKRREYFLTVDKLRDLFPHLSTDEIGESILECKRYRDKIYKLKQASDDPVVQESQNGSDNQQDLPNEENR